MPTINLDKNELLMVTDAMKQAIDSAKRQQNMKGKTQTIKEVYEQHERTLTAVLHKIASAK